jgi:hypothetical protein
MRRTAALILGGGPAGSAAAIALARAGIEAELIERSEGPHDTVCGGFMGWDALAALERLGVDPAALGARPIRRLRLISAKRSIEVALPRLAAGLSRRTLDEAMLGRRGDGRSRHPAGAHGTSGRSGGAPGPARRRGGGGGRGPRPRHRQARASRRRPPGRHLDPADRLEGRLWRRARRWRRRSKG